MSACLSDAAFGPAVRGCRGNFDFTLKFEMIFLDILPNSIFIIIFISRIAHLVTQPTVAKDLILRALKTVRIGYYSSNPVWMDTQTADIMRYSLPYLLI